MPKQNQYQKFVQKYITKAVRCLNDISPECDTNRFVKALRYLMKDEEKAYSEYAIENLYKWAVILGDEDVHDLRCKHIFGALTLVDLKKVADKEAQKQLALVVEEIGERGIEDGWLENELITTCFAHVPVCQVCFFEAEKGIRDAIGMFFALPGKDKKLLAVPYPNEERCHYHVPHHIRKQLMKSKNHDLSNANAVRKLDFSDVNLAANLENVLHKGV